MPGRRHTILIVDDDLGVLESLKYSLEADYDILAASGGAEGLGLLSRHEVALIISDQRMPEITGVEFLEKAQEISPRSVRMMLTGFADFEAIVGAINQGQIYRYISKPWEPLDLRIDVRRAVETYELQSILERRMQELRTLCEIGATITAVLDVNEGIRVILDAVVGALGFDRSFLMLIDEDRGVLRARACSGVTGHAKDLFTSLEYRLDREDAAVLRTIREDRSLLVEDVDDLPVEPDREALRRIGIESFATAPLRVGERRIGVLMADRSRAKGGVEVHDQRLLMGFADQAAIAIENARLYSEAMEKKELEEEVAVAARIQQYLLPRSLPQVNGFEVVGKAVPNRWVSGDYFDVLEDRSGRLWVALGDVSGKGVPAALTMATLRALFRAELEREHSMSEVMRRIDHGLWLSTAPEVFATFCFGILDPAAMTFTYVNAGHPPPVLVRAGGDLGEQNGAGLPLGLDPGLTGGNDYPEHRVEFNPGDMVLIYSDGVTEAGAGRDDMFGEDRLKAVVNGHRAGGALAVQEAVCDAVRSFLGEAPPEDDLTLVVIGARE